MSVCLLLLAAGRSRRFGGDKRQALLPSGATLLQQATENALASGMEVWVCLRPDDDSLAADIAALGAHPLLCANAHLGMAHTLADGVAVIARLQAANTGLLVAPGDMPCIQPATFCAVAKGLGAGRIHVPVWHGKRGHPVGFGGDFHAQLAGLSGDQGARALLYRHSASVSRIPVDDPGILQDVDRPAELVRAGANAPAGTRNL